MAPPPPNNVDAKTFNMTAPTYRRSGSGGAGPFAPSSATATYTTKSTPAWQRRHFSNHRLPLSYNEKGSNSGRIHNFFARYCRRWRWWNVLCLLILALGLIQLAAVFVGGALLHRQPPPIRIALRQYPAVRYQPLQEHALATPITRGTTVYHVTKEFGSASMGGMGMIVTALASAQQRSGLVRSAVVMPYYSFLKNKHRPEKVIDLVIDVRDKNGRLIPMEFRVWRMIHIIDSETAATISANAANSTLSVMDQAKQLPLTEQVPVYLIGPGNRKPFNLAFRARKTLDIYSCPPGLPQEWKDQYFDKAVAEFLVHQAASPDEVPLFAPARVTRHVDVVHIHGATNAYIAKHLKDFQRRNQLGPRPPVIMYTMHDYLDELQYTNTWNNVKKFMNEPDEMINKYMRGNRVFMSSMGIDYADVVTFVSGAMAKDIVEGRDDFYLKELVMQSILRKAERGRFFGITNGVDFGTLNPFTHPRLIQRKSDFPEFGRALIQQQTKTLTDERTVWHLAPTTKEYVMSAKDRAKKYLIRRNRLSKEDLDRPVVLFVGRFQYNKGLEIFETAVQYFVKHNMKFVIIGQRNNYPLEWVKALQERYPDNVIVMSTAQQQRQWSVYYRAAADFAFVPSLTESFGLVAAEGLLFGSPVISTGAGGLKEFLIDRPVDGARNKVHVTRDKHTNAPIVTSKENYNAYLFEPATLGKAIEDAAEDYRRNKESKVRREEFILRMIRSAFALGWDRGQQQGPVHDYLQAYNIAISERRIPRLSRHELTEEQALLSRLQV
ncbi:hypothetical protein BDB00DRAFT_805914 [Zychaea mexicana]|uniref:uncharacterized protein n=1 Tax=Zychaea mexicana TaxID=64656 RepID=UPI0022FED138|nr:uncharacterized protein BDB00DRAFT_805914 [Zychaea mexicana]KAI9497308.1 hypothetical protein BDB00DRAFT_805914 [Zychaea mexicana]